MFDPSYLRSPVESPDASKTQLYIGMFFLLLTLASIIIQYYRLVKNIRANYKLTEVPFIYFLTIFTGLLLVIINEIIILSAIIYSDQEFTYLGRENALFIVMGLGFFIYGWTQVLLFNLALKRRVRTLIGIAFLGAMSFYVFAVVITILITFQVVDTNAFVGIGYPTAVAIYGVFLLIDLIVMIYVANTKRRMSKYQSWIGFLLLSSLLLNFLSIIFNALPLIIVGKVDPDIHAVFNYIVEPIVYFVTDTMSLLLISWVLFNPQWLNSRIIEEGT